MLSDLSEADLLAALIEMIRSMAGGTVLPCTADSELLRDLGLSSINVVMLLTEACEKLGFDIYKLTDGDLVRLRTVRDVARLLQAKA
jgi:acyl carrier protein